MHTHLFVPATRTERIIKALTDPNISPHIHAIIIDLEDAVADSDPVSVREGLTKLLSNLPKTPTPKLWVRIHGASHTEFRADSEFVRLQPAISTVILPKADNAQQVSLAHELTARPIIAMIESGQGVVNIATIAQANGVCALSYGCLDLLTSLGITMNTKASALMFDKIRTELVLHSQANGLSAPIETIYPNFQDDEGFKAWLTHAQNFGFGGVLAIHPKQLAIISSLNEREGDLCFAKKVLAHHDSTGEAVFAIDGQMVDLPVITWAREILGK